MFFSYVMFFRDLFCLLNATPSVKVTSGMKKVVSFSVVKKKTGSSDFGTPCCECGAHEGTRTPTS